MNELDVVGLPSSLLVPKPWNAREESWKERKRNVSSPEVKLRNPKFKNKMDG